MKGVGKPANSAKGSLKNFVQKFGKKIPINDHQQILYQLPMIYIERIT